MQRGPAQAKTYPVTYSDAEWRRRLTAAQYAVLRQKGTERPGTSPLLREHRTGTFVCAADGNPLFASATKYESGTGWPSFWRPLPGAHRHLDRLGGGLCRAPKCTARAAAGIWAMCSMMARAPQASAIA